MIEIRRRPERQGDGQAALKLRRSRSPSGRIVAGRSIACGRARSYRMRAALALTVLTHRAPTPGFASTSQNRAERST
jgi:hypothetical protein